MNVALEDVRHDADSVGVAASYPADSVLVVQRRPAAVLLPILIKGRRDRCKR